MCKSILSITLIKRYFGGDEDRWEFLRKFRRNYVCTIAPRISLWMRELAVAAAHGCCCPFERRAYSRRCRVHLAHGSGHFADAEISSTDVSAISISDTHDLFMKKAPRAAATEMVAGPCRGGEAGGRRRGKRATMHYDSLCSGRTRARERCINVGI